MLEDKRRRGEKRNEFAIVIDLWWWEMSQEREECGYLKNQWQWRKKCLKEERRSVEEWIFHIDRPSIMGDGTGKRRVWLFKELMRKKINVWRKRGEEERNEFSIVIDLRWWEMGPEKEECGYLKISWERCKKCVREESLLHLITVMVWVINSILTTVRSRKPTDMRRGKKFECLHLGEIIQVELSVKGTRVRICERGIC